MVSVSIIVPVYKVEAYIDECISSILNQSFRDFELILVDDGSPDRCGEICDHYAAEDHRVRVIHQQNGGLSAARNAGIEIMRGKYVLFVDSDDALHVDALKYLYEAMKQSNAKIAVAGFTREFGGIHTEIPRPKDRTMTGEYACKMIAGEETKEDDASSIITFVSAWGKLIQSSLLHEVRFPVGKLHEDEFVTYRLYYEAGRVVLVDAPLYYYRTNANGITSSKTIQNQMDAFEAWFEREKFYRDRGNAELAKKTSEMIQYLLPEYVIQRQAVGIKTSLPKEYQMSELQALKKLYHRYDRKKFLDCLAALHPNAVEAYYKLSGLKNRLRHQ